MYNIGFVIEQVLGHITHADNLRATVPEDPEVCAHWGLIPYPVTGVGRHVPVYNRNWTVRVGVRARRALWEIGRQGPLDALFFHTQVPATMALDWVRRVPSIVSLDATPLQYDELGAFYEHASGTGTVELLKWRLHRATFDAARHLVTWSEWARQGLIKDYGIAPEKITVVPPGVTVSDWLRPSPRVLDTGTVKVLFVGGDLERKGGLLLLEAFRQLRPYGVELHLVTRADVPEEPGLFVHRAMQPNSPALKALYHSCDIFALPTLGDCLPMVLSEAGAAGMAIVSTDVAAIPEVVRDGETGVIVPRADQDALTVALRRLIEHPTLRLDLGARAVTHIVQGYDTRKNVTRLLELLKGQASIARVPVRAA